MAKPVNIPNSFATSTSAIPLSYLDQDFNALANSTNDLATYSNYVADTGAANAYIANFPTNINTSSLTAGLRVQFKAANANTGTSTLNVQVNSVSIGSGTIKLTDGSNLPANAIVAGALVDVMYDGTNFQLLSDSSGGAEVITNLTVTGNASVAGTTTLTGNLAVDTNVLFVDTASNNVGIGTSSPATTLDVRSPAASGANADVAYFMNPVNNVTATAATIKIGATSVTTRYSYIQSLVSSGVNGQSLCFGTNANGATPTEKMRIDDAGNVGIGTSSPVNLLTIESTSNVRATIRNSTENTSYASSLDFATGSGSLSSSNVVGRVIGLITQADPSTLQSALSFHTNSGDSVSEKMRIDSSGNVGIGTTSPSALLQTFNNQASSTTATVQKWSWSDPSASATWGLQVDQIHTGSAIDYAFRIRPNSTTPLTALYMQATTGNVGIGTTSPSAPLDVRGSSGLIRTSSTTGTNTSNIGFTNSGGSFYVGLDSSTGGNFGAGNYGAVIYNGANSPMVFFTNAAERMRIDSSGNVGIGTTSPTYNFHVKETDGATSISSIFETTVAGGSYISFKDTGTSQPYNVRVGSVGEALAFQTSSAERMRIDSSGNVGIGTSSPVAQLGIYGSGQTTAAMSTSTNLGGTLYLRDSGGSPGNGGALIFGALQGAFTAIKGFITDGANNTVGALAFSTRNASTDSTLTERMRIDASGFTQFSSNQVMPYQGAPTSKAAAATITGAELITGILNTTGTTYTITLPTGTNIEGALTWVGNNVSLDWYVINTASGTITIGANGNTTLGGLTIATGVSAHFRIRRTAANTFTVYRLS